MHVCMYVHAHTRTHEVIFLGSNAPISHWLASADSVRQSLSLALSSGELANKSTPQFLLRIVVYHLCPECACLGSKIAPPPQNNYHSD